MADYTVKRQCETCGVAISGNPRKRFCRKRSANTMQKRNQRGSTPRPRPAANRMDISPVDLAWVAGIAEGEGCFHRQRSPYKDRVYIYPSFRIGMVDEDIIRRCQEVTGLGRVNRQHPPSHQAKGAQPTWVWSLSRADEVVTLAGALWPHMGIRRRAQITSVLTDWRKSYV